MTRNKRQFNHEYFLFQELKNTTDPIKQKHIQNEIDELRLDTINHLKFQAKVSLNSEIITDMERILSILFSDKNAIANDSKLVPQGIVRRLDKLV